MKTTHKASAHISFEGMRNRSEQLDDLITESFELVRRYLNPLQPLSYIHLFHTTRKTIVDFHLSSQIEFVRVHCSHGWKNYLNVSHTPEWSSFKNPLTHNSHERSNRGKKVVIHIKETFSSLCNLDPHEFCSVAVASNRVNSSQMKPLAYFFVVLSREVSFFHSLHKSPPSSSPPLPRTESFVLKPQKDEKCFSM